MKGKRKMNCPNCGGAIKIKDNKKVCEYCGYEELLPPGTTPGNDDFYNLMVFNESQSSNEIAVKLAESNLGFIIRSGEAVAKDVPPGYHTMVVTCDGMTEYRSVCVPGDGKAVRVYVSKAAFGIAIRVSEPGSPDRTTGVVNSLTGTGARVTSENVLPIMSLVFSFIIPFVGLIMALVDLTNSKKQGKKVHACTTAALIISCIRFAIMILMVIITLVGSVAASM